MSRLCPCLSRHLRAYPWLTALKNDTPKLAFLTVLQRVGRARWFGWWILASIGTSLQLPWNNESININLHLFEADLLAWNSGTGYGTMEEMQNIILMKMAYCLGISSKFQVTCRTRLVKCWFQWYESQGFIANTWYFGQLRSHRWCVYGSLNG